MSGAHQPPARASQPPLTSPFRIGEVEIANRVLLAPLAGIGNWFVRLQARRYGAGLAVSEMISSHALKHRNERTMREMLVVHPDEHPVSIQLFGADPAVMEEAAEIAASSGADMLDLNMGCPVKKVLKTGAGAALLSDPDLAVEVAAAAVRGSGLPVTTKVRSGLEPGDRSGVELSLRLADEAGVLGIGFHPRPATVHHKGEPDYAMVSELVERIDVPVIVSGGLADAAAARHAYEASGADAVMVARGGFGYPWIFAELTGTRREPPSRQEILAELRWVVDSAERLYGARAYRYLRKFYPWYMETLGVDRATADGFQRWESLEEVRAGLDRLEPKAAAETPVSATAGVR